MIKLGKAPKERWAKGSKITSIRIPFLVARVVEALGIKAKTHSATDTILQILEGFTKGKKVPKGVKLKWAKKPDKSARKDYNVKAKSKSKKKVAKRAAKKAKADKHAKKKAAPRKAVKRKASAYGRAVKNAKDRARRAAKKAAAAPTNGGPPAADQPADSTPPATT
jgi:hypothetical protein